jgi:hypothetical protein
VPASPIRDLNPAVSLKAAIAASKAAPLTPITGATDYSDKGSDTNVVYGVGVDNKAKRQTIEAFSEKGKWKIGN